MSPADFERSVRFVADELLPKFGCSGINSTITIQYVGGEILLVPPAELRQCVETAREVFSGHFGEVIDGVQSNLVASERRVMALDTLFSGRIGTSVDGKGVQRTVGGSADAYRAAVGRAREALMRRRRRNPGSIFVVDRAGLANVRHEIETASKIGYPLVLRPVFNGGRSIDEAPLADLVHSLSDAFDAWAMKASVPVEPFMYLIAGRLKMAGPGSVCPFQRNCAEVSLDIEPDGTLYTCLDMADSGQYPLGNAIEGRFDWDTWNMLRDRKTVVDPRCAACPFFATCQGGCMSEAIHHTGSPHGRSDLCSVWTALFKRIDALIADRGRNEVSSWFRSLTA
jgi:radical SAM protein with 4Fe4S-binding SPASM domain